MLRNAGWRLRPARKNWRAAKRRGLFLSAEIRLDVNHVFRPATFIAHGHHAFVDPDNLADNIDAQTVLAIFYPDLEFELLADFWRQAHGAEQQTDGAPIT